MDTLILKTTTVGEPGDVLLAEGSLFPTVSSTRSTVVVDLSNGARKPSQTPVVKHDGLTLIYGPLNENDDDDDYYYCYDDYSYDNDYCYCDGDDDDDDND